MTLDRVAPTRRPDRAVTGRQRWLDLLFMHWSAPPEVVRPLLPAGLELDVYDGKAWIGLVPFAMKDIRPSWVPKALGLDFLETNVRTYVHYNGEPGVYFFSLEAASNFAVKVARWQWSLAYHHADMRMERDGDRVRYETTRRSNQARLSVEYTIGEALGPSPVGTFEHFLLERYYLFVEHEGRLFQGQVHHVPYPAHRAEVHRLEDGLVAAAGLPAVSFPPEVVHCSPGVTVEVFGPWPCT